MQDQRPTFGVAAIGIIHRPGLPDDATTAPEEFSIRLPRRSSPSTRSGRRGSPFSRLVVVLYMDRAAPRSPADPLTHRVESVERMPEVGLFATRSPRRPNPLGLCYPRLLGRDGNLLRVRGLDGWPGTLVLDIKGYYSRDERRDDATIPAWLQRLWARHDAERGTQRV